MFHHYFLVIFFILSSAEKQRKVLKFYCQNISGPNLIFNPSRECLKFNFHFRGKILAKYISESHYCDSKLYAQDMSTAVSDFANWAIWIAFKKIYRIQKNSESQSKLADFHLQKKLFPAWISSGIAFCKLHCAIQNLLWIQWEILEKRKNCDILENQNKDGIQQHGYHIMSHFQLNFDCSASEFLTEWQMICMYILCMYIE